MVTDNYWTRNNGWIYNAASKEISFLYNYETPDSEYSYWEEFDVLEKSAAKLVIKSNAYGYTQEYNKQ